MMPQAIYSTAQVARVTGVTLRQLQWWDERKLLKAPQVKHSRQYSEREMFAAALFRDLKERGFSIQVIRRIWKQMERKQFTVPDESRRWMLTDGKRVEFVADPDVVLAFLEQRRSPAFVLVPLASIAGRLAEAALHALPIMRKPAARALEFAGLLQEALQA